GWGGTDAVEVAAECADMVDTGDANHVVDVVEYRRERDTGDASPHRGSEGAQLAGDGGMRVGAARGMACGDPGFDSLVLLAVGGVEEEGEEVELRHPAVARDGAELIVGEIARVV